MATVPLGGVLGALNHLIAAILEESASHSGRTSLVIDGVAVDAASCRIAGGIRTPDGVDRFVLRVEVTPPQGAKQSLRVRVEQWPAHLPALLEWVRPLLERAELGMDLDFGPWLPPQQDESR
jgi:hypothetical protein